MNWLIYIGGGLVVNIFSYYFIAFLGRQKISFKGTDPCHDGWFMMLGTLLAWIWICWKFIR